ncbi:MAG: HIT family protein [Candidatus Komeilibacteria bacterium]|nr:HIT family protein [Candidatus Komeilibacteria bacterium]
MLECIFCKIIAKEIPTEFVYEDDRAVAFLDIHPTNPGHLLVVPKSHVADFLAVSVEDLAACMKILQKIARVLPQAYNTPDFNIMQNNGVGAGQIVPHLHWHLIPRYPADPLRIYPHEKNYDETVAEFRTKIKQILA